MNKLLIILLSLLMIITVGCSKEEINSFEKYIEEGKISIANEEYDKALNFFTLAKEAIEGNADNEELNLLYSQTKSLIEADEIENSKEFTEGDMVQLKEAVSKCFLKWDRLLNKIYGELKKQLPEDEMGDLREKQRVWIKYRDSESQKSSEDYKGTTMELLQYNAKKRELTRQRCYELVNKYAY